jgi:phosphoglycerate dehydrogenase-like enzyme
MRIAFFGPPGFGPLEQLRGALPAVDIVVGQTAAELREHMGGIDVILLAPRQGRLLTELWLESRHVRWIHALAAGVETLPFDLLGAREVIVTNSRGLYADALGEFAVAAILWFAKGLGRLQDARRERRWDPFDVERVEGRTVGIVGYGAIGKGVGRRVESLGMRVLALRRRSELGDPSLDELLTSSDYVVISTPLTPATTGLINRARIALMRPEGVLINIGRGRVVDEAALAEALGEKRIRGAALDVFETEPLPADSPLWSLDNVLLSPHCADHTSDAHERAMAFFIENLVRFQKGEPLENVVDKNEQY